jgi:PAS domain S-box-containing protein
MPFTTTPLESIVELTQPLFSNDFMPHGYCYLWDSRMVWLHVISDGVIGLSYYVIPLFLLFFGRKNRALLLNRVSWIFAAFVLACGTTHFLEIWNIWHGSYLMAGINKAITAILSLAAAGILVPLLPRLIALPSQLQLEAVNRKLVDEIAAGKRVLEERERLAALVESSEDAIVGKTLDGTINAWNHSAEKLFGYPSTEAMGKSIEMLFPPERLSEEATILAKIGRGERVKHFETERIRKDGQRIDVWVTISPVRNSSGTIVGASKIARDITENKRVERALRESLATSEAALKDLADQKFALDQHAIVSVTDVEGTITYVNDKFCAISQYSREELLGKDHRLINSGHHSREFFRQMYATIAGGQVWRGEFKNRAKDGSVYWVDSTIVPFLGTNGKPRQYVSIRADITQRKIDEQEIHKLNDELEHRVIERTAQLEAANKELEAFSYSVSHDLRAPLRHISAFSRLLAEEVGDRLDATSQHYLDRIYSGTQEMGQLVDELLNLARVGRHALNRQTTNLNTIVSQVVALLQTECERRQVKWITADLPPLDCDPILIKQVFQNLLANAVKFTRTRTHAVIEITHRDAGKESPCGPPVFVVRDNGIGFDMKYVDKLFGVFQRLHPAADFEGTGIGLATVQRIIQKHGGRVWAEGGVNQGAAFYFTLGNGKQTESKSNAAATGGCA